MKKSVLGIIVAFVFIAAIAGIVVASNKTNKTTTTPTQPSASSHTSDMDHSNNSLPDGMTHQTTQQSSNEVEIRDYTFSPAVITVKKGTTVTWTNRDSAKHDITPDTKTDFFMPSELLAKDESYSFTFDTTGTYNYYCSPHPYMKGVVEVTE